MSDVVMLHWFGGMKYSAVAEVLKVSVSTVEKDFRYALAWLSRRLDQASSPP
jgi:DNA-directed RNA polymerase specialized sigma24 family protein